MTEEKKRDLCMKFVEDFIALKNQISTDSESYEIITTNSAKINSAGIRDLPYRPLYPLCGVTRNLKKPNEDDESLLFVVDNGEIQHQSNRWLNSAHMTDSCHDYLLLKIVAKQ